MMLIREAYADIYLPSSRDKNPANYYYSTVMKYPEEDGKAYNNRYELTLEEYVRHDVKKYFGLTINEYLDLTMREKEAMLDICTKEAERALKAAKSVEEDSNAKLGAIKKTMNSVRDNKPIRAPVPLDGFDMQGLFGEE